MTLTLNAAILEMDEHRFLRMMRDLEQRSRHEREAGAFLLGYPGTRKVACVEFYDELDPDSLTGAITFHASGYSALNRVCRERGMTVLADIHLHPGQSTTQSPADAANPMVARSGHLALIAPTFGAGVERSEQLSAYVKITDGWTPYQGPKVKTVFTVRPTFRGKALRVLLRLSSRLDGGPKR